MVSLHFRSNHDRYHAGAGALLAVFAVQEVQQD